MQKATGPEVLIHFSVRDTGIGISQQNISRLFQSFSQVALHCTNLGCTARSLDLVLPAL